MPFPCAKTIPKSDQTSTLSIFRARKRSERNGAPFAGEVTRSFSLLRTYTCSQHFDTKDIVKTLCGIKKDNKRGASNDIQPTRGSKLSGPSEREKRMISREEKEI